VTMQWWDDLWLNESFATWMAYKIVDRWRPGWRVWLDFDAGKAAALQLDALRSTHPIRAEVKNPEDMTAEERTAWEARRANNAFLKLRPISDELASFMGLSPKSQKSQTDVTKYIATYVKEHSCFDPSFKRRIIPDAKLGKLLRVKDGQEVTYLNLQSFLKVHFLKPAA